MTGAKEAAGIVCVGASAGGLRSLEALLGRLPEDFPWPILVSQHLQAEHVSLMPQILARATKLKVQEAAEGDVPAGGTIYTCPSSAEMGLTPEGRIALRPPVAGRPQRIDHLLATAAFARPGMMVAVILSGTGNDGAAGSLVVKLNGGSVIAESDESALQTAMPKAAIKAGTVDAVLSAAAIAPALAGLASGGLEGATAATARELRAIAETLTSATGTNFSEYRFATLRRRVEKRRALVGAATLQEYGALVKREGKERDALVRSLLIPVTEFFRDPLAWDALASEVLPVLAEKAREGRTIRVWCAGCASGEEAYSLAIAMLEAGIPPERLSIVATDLDAGALQQAGAGTYDAGRMANVGASRRARFFHARKGAFGASDGLQDVIEFRLHDLTRDPPPEGPFDVVVCRNVLIYFDDPLQQRVLRAFEDALRPGGTLFLGRSEAIPKQGGSFEPISRTLRIFRSSKDADAAAAPPGGPLVQSARAGPAFVFPNGEAPRIAAVLVEDSDALILALDDAWGITVANRRARDALGSALVGRSVLDVFPHWQGSPVQDALRTALATGRSVRILSVPTAMGFLDVDLEPMAESRERSLLLVARPTTPKRGGARLARDHEELREDLETTNDELQTANEELAAANEELQASNEELASLNEEFLSTNQNLASTNAEMRANAADARPQDPLHAVLAGSSAAVACDLQRRITMYTPQAAELFGLRSGAAGQGPHVGDLGIPPEELGEWLRASTQAAAPIRRLHARAGGSLEVTIATLKDSADVALGWLLTWAAAPVPPPAAER